MTELSTAAGNTLIAMGVVFFAVTMAIAALTAYGEWCNEQRNMNIITIHGHLTRDPETRNTSKDGVCNFTVAVNRRFDRETSDFFSCTAWGKTGELIQKYFTKGSEIALCGEMRSRSYEAKDGSKRTAWDINVDQIDFCGKAGGNKREGQSCESAKPLDSNALNGFTDIDDSDLPF